MADRMEGVTNRTVRPTQGRHTIELISGHTADGSIALAEVNVTLDGVDYPGEVIVLVTEMDPRDPEGEVSLQPLALVLDDRWYDHVSIVIPGADE